MDTLYDIINTRRGEVEDALAGIRADFIDLREDGAAVVIVEVEIDWSGDGYTGATVASIGNEVALVRITDGGLEVLSDSVTAAMAEAVEAAITGPETVYEPDSHYVF